MIGLAFGHCFHHPFHFLFRQDVQVANKTYTSSSNMQEENTEEVPMKRRKVLRNVREDDEYNEDGRPAERDTDNVISNIDEQYRTEILRVEEEMVAFFKCNSKSPYTCSFTTRKKQSMVTHIKGVHYGIKPFRCNECSFACAYKAKLRGHQMKRHGATQAWLPDGYSRIFRIVCVWPFGLLDYGSATLRCKI